MREQRGPKQPDLVWDVALVKRLLRGPSWLLRDPLWGPWMSARGGLPHVIAYLRQLPLSEDERALLNLLLERPDDSVVRYTDQLSITRSTYFSRLSRLLEALASYLNAWEVQPPATTVERPAPPKYPTPALAPSPAPGVGELPVFLGRRRELLALRDYLATPTIRLVTLTGPGGIGKTSLALRSIPEVGPLFREGARFVSLAALAAPEFVASTIMQALGVQELQHLPPLDQLVARLANQHLLLVLDNVEHLGAAWNTINQLIQRTSQLKILVTSRVLLHLSGEQELRVPPLDLPNAEQAQSSAQALEAPAIALFLERARMAQPSLAITDANVALVGRICRQLDGLPLAIELAAARLKLLTLDQLAERLDSRLELLSRGFADLPARHQSLRRTMDWSYSLLPPPDQAAFARLGVFAGGFTLAAATRVLAETPGAGHAHGDSSIAILDSLTNLLDNSLLYREPSDKPRCAMLETVREYALELLSGSGEAPQIRLRHAQYYLELARQAEGLTNGPEQFDWYRQLQLEYNNLRGALSWAEESGDETLLAALVAALKDFWWHHGYHDESQRWVETALRVCQSAAARGQIALSVAKHYRTYAQAVVLARVAADYHRQHGNIEQCGWALLDGGKSLFETGAYEEAEQTFLEAQQLFAHIGHAAGQAQSLIHRGLLAMKFGDNERARTLLQESLAFHNHPDEINLQLGIIARNQGDLEEARSRLGAVLQRGEDTSRQQWIGYAALNLGQIADEEGHLPQALELFLRARAAFRQLGDDLGIAYVLEALTILEERRQAPEALRRSAQLLGAMEALRSRIGAPLPPVNRDNLAPLLARLERALGPQLAAERAAGAVVEVDALLASLYAHTT